MRKIANFYPTLSESWMLFGLFLACSWMSGFSIGLLKSVVPIGGSWVFLISYIATYILLTGFVVLYLNGRLWKTVDDPVPAKKITLGLCLLLLVTVPCLSILMEPLSAWIPYPSWFNYEELMQNFIVADFPTFFSVAIAAPVLEEGLFRGVILKGLLKYHSPWKAILWSSFMFGIMHLNPWQAIPAFGLGIFFGWIYWRTGSLWVCMFMHFVNNGMAFLIQYRYPQANNTVDIFGDRYAYILLAAFILLVGFGYLLYRMVGKGDRAG